MFYNGIPDVFSPNRWALVFLIRILMGEANPVVNRYLIIEFIIETLVLVVCCAVSVLRIALVSELRVVSNITM